jgi:hypothetical protein
MRDWKAIAKARGIEIPAGDLDRTVEPLDEMEEIFRSLIPDLTPDIEPAFDVRLEGDE